MEQENQMNHNFLKKLFAQDWFIFALFLDYIFKNVSLTQIPLDKIYRIWVRAPSDQFQSKLSWIIVMTMSELEMSFEIWLRRGEGGKNWW